MLAIIAQISTISHKQLVCLIHETTGTLTLSTNRISHLTFFNFIRAITVKLFTDHLHLYNMLRKFIVCSCSKNLFAIYVLSLRLWLFAIKHMYSITHTIIFDDSPFHGHMFHTLKYVVSCTRTFQYMKHVLCIQLIVQSHICFHSWIGIHIQTFYLSVHYQEPT